MNNKPISMEEYFLPGFKTKPAVHIGSQTLDLFKGVPAEQAWEGVTLAGSSDEDVVVVRNIDPTYLKYWKSLFTKIRILNLTTRDSGNFLTKVLLESRTDREWIEKNMKKDASLMVFFPTELEQKLADKLKIPLHGSPYISNLYGTKSGIRKLAKENDIPMAPGFICTTYKQAQEAVDLLKNKFESIIIKHDSSVTGYYSKKLATKGLNNIKKEIGNLTGKPLIEGKDIFVVEGWLKSKLSLCAQIEIKKDQEPIVCAGWQQIIAKDEITYIGGGPLILSKKALQSFMNQVNKLAQALKQKGAIGSFGPDFLITSDDSCVLVELNARVPYTAFPLEIIKQIKGKIGSGFYTKHIKLNKKNSFKDIEQILKRERLLITEKDSQATGVVPYNIGLLPWNLFDVVIMADSWEQTLPIIDKVNNIFN